MYCWLQVSFLLCIIVCPQFGKLLTFQKGPPSSAVKMTWHLNPVLYLSNSKPWPWTTKSWKSWVFCSTHAPTRPSTKLKKWKQRQRPQYHPRTRWKPRMDWREERNQVDWSIIYSFVFMFIINIGIFAVWWPILYEVWFHSFDYNVHHSWLTANSVHTPVIHMSQSYYFGEHCFVKLLLNWSDDNAINFTSLCRRSIVIPGKTLFVFDLT